jgi:hypothetical protein
MRFMNPGQTDADLMETLRRNLGRIIDQAGRQVAELESGIFSPELQPDRGRIVLGNIRSTGLDLLRELETEARGAVVKAE